MAHHHHHLEPLSIFLVKRGGAGDRVLFRYPHEEPAPRSSGSHRQGESHSDSNPYTLHEDTTTGGGGGGTSSCGGGGNTSVCGSNPYWANESERLTEESVTSLSCQILANLFATVPQICDNKFDLKVDDVRFVGHPISLELKPEDAKMYYRFRSGDAIFRQSLSMFQVVFALSSMASYSVVKCYHDLSLQLAVGIRYEDRRSGYLQRQSQILLNALDELAPRDSTRSPYLIALEESQLARDLKKVFEDVSSTGYVEVRIDNWSEIMFCLPQKVHKRINPNLLVEPESILKCMEQLRPYHALLLLQNERELIEELPLDYNTAVKKVIEQASPVKNFRVLAADTNISKLFVFQISMQLLYWGKATVIFPICNTNTYVIAPNIANHLSASLTDQFSDLFHGLCLAEFLQIFSLPNNIPQAVPSMSRKDEHQRVARMIVWCLQHHLLIQLHTYITLTITDECDTTLPDPTEVPQSQQQQLAAPSPTRRRSASNVASLATTTTTTEQKREDKWPPLHTVREDLFGGACSGGFQASPQLSDGELLSQFTEKERAAIMAVPAASNLDDLRLFVRLAPFFNGKHHLEEIMYRVNVTRSLLIQLIDKFRSVLVRHEQEDVNITTYFNLSF